MKRRIIVIAVLAIASLQAYAGGFLTNTNQSVSFLRQPAQNSVISVNGAYFNPAGVGFMDKGWALSIGIMNAHQKREIESTFAPFAYGAKNNQQQSKLFSAKTVAPVLPSVDVAYNGGRLFGSLHIGITGGGGKAPFNDGLGSFESQIAMLPGIVNAIARTSLVNGYSADIALEGSQYYASGQVNLGYKINEHFSVAAGLRGTYVLNIYEGGLRNISLSYAADPSVLGPYAAALSAFAGDKELDCTQKDIVLTPVIGIDVNYGKFNFAGRYEFRGDVDLENSTKKNTTGMAQYDDKAVVSSDIPALLALGVRYSLLPQFRVMVDYNLYFDKQSNVYNSLTGKDDKTSLIDSNPYEVLAGLEYDLNKKWTVSGGVQFTRFGYGKKAEYISDMSFNPSSVSVGLGCRYKLNDRISFDFGVFKTFYEHINKEMADYNNVGASLYQKIAAAAPALAGSFSAEMLKTPGKDNFFRKSFVAGIGFNYAF